VKGIILTHGHEDHIGALPWVLKEIHTPIYGTALTWACEKEARGAPLDKSTKYMQNQGEGPDQDRRFRGGAIRVNHSVADSVAFAIHTPVGVVVHTGTLRSTPPPFRAR
jgi:ribonuclease J